MNVIFGGLLLVGGLILGYLVLHGDANRLWSDISHANAKPKKAQTTGMMQV